VLRDGVASDPAIVALLVAVFALGRRESRGAHARTDFPAPASVASRQAMTLAAALDLAGAINLRSLSRSA
jgi:L-aspartate oxidase